MIVLELRSGHRPDIKAIRSVTLSIDSPPANLAITATGRKRRSK